jgi:hypothetical protein
MSNTNMNIATPEAARAEVEYLVRIGQEIRAAEEAVQVLNIDGNTFTAHRGNLERVKPPHPEKPEVFKAFSLSGLVDFIKADVDRIFEEGMPHIVRVVSPKRVEVLSPMIGPYHERFIEAECDALVPDIPFGRFQGVDEFQIMLQSRFEDSANRALVLQLSGSLRTEQANQIADDGVSQKVTIKRGVATADDVTVKNPVVLKPLRTFYEVAQPESPFILRFNENANAALFEGDGGAWKLRAVENIRAWLAGKLERCNVVVIA